MNGQNERKCKQKFKFFSSEKRFERVLRNGRRHPDENKSGDLNFKKSVEQTDHRNRLFVWLRSDWICFVCWRQHCIISIHKVTTIFHTCSTAHFCINFCVFFFSLDVQRDRKKIPLFVLLSHI